MASVHFSFKQLDGGQPQAAQWSQALQNYKLLVDREYYESDCVIEMPVGELDLNLDKISLGSVEMVRYSSSSKTSCVRTWQHIRKDQIDIYVIWFVIRGSLNIAQEGRAETVAAQEFALSTSGLPYRIVALPDPGGQLESVQVLVPSRLMVGLLPSAKHFCARRFCLTSPSRVSFQLLTHLMAEEDAMPANISSSLAYAALHALTAAVRETWRVPQHGAKVNRKRQILEYIDRHLSEPGLTVNRVAEACRMSPRYLHMLFAGDVQPGFHKLVWHKRLLCAYELLTNPQLGRVQVAEIAHMVGFKNAAHFSTAFRQKYGRSPRCVRDAVARNAFAMA